MWIRGRVINIQAEWWKRQKNRGGETRKNLVGNGEGKVEKKINFIFTKMLEGAIANVWYAEVCNAYASSIQYAEVRASWRSCILSIIWITMSTLLTLQMLVLVIEIYEGLLLKCTLIPRFQN